MFEDWSEDVPRTYDDEPAGHVLGPLPELPSEQHRRLLQVLHATARPGAGGYPVSGWWQRDLAKRLQVSERTLKRLVADLREPGPPDSRNPGAGQAAGLRLGLVKVETTKYHDQATGQHRRGHNVYVLLVPWPVVATIPVRVLRATPKLAVTSADGGGVALGKQERALSLEREVSSTGVTGVSSTEAPPVPAVLEVGGQHEPSWADQRLDPDQVLDRLRGVFGDAELLELRPNEPAPVTYTTARGRQLDLAGGSLADFHRAVDQLDRDTCMDGGCHPGHRCRRHSRRQRT